jgi:histidinol-phosphatase
MTSPDAPSPTDQEQAARLELAVQFAQAAGEHTLKYFGSDRLVIERKSDESPVTVADREAEELLRRMIAEAFPDDGILGEEFPETPGTSGYRWILDPIDGTKSFIHGVPLYSTLIGIEHQGDCFAGVIRLPALQQEVYARRGAGAWTRDDDSPPRAAHVSSVETLSESLFLTSEVICFDEVGREPAFQRFQQETRLTRTWGDGYGYYLLATGRAELMIDPYLNCWDAAPMLPIVIEAGGTFTDWQGNETIHNEEAIGTNGRIFEETMTIAKGYPKRPS